MGGTTSSERRGPVVLVLVYGVFLVLVGITASTQAVLVSSRVSSTMLSAVVSSDAATVRAFVNGNIVPGDLEPTSPVAARAAQIEGQLASLASLGDILRVEIRLPDGTVLAGDLPSLTGAKPPTDAAFARAAAGSASAEIVPDDGASGIAAGGSLGTSNLVREYLPLMTEGIVRGIVCIWRDAAPVLGEVEAARRDVVALTLSAAIIVALLLYFIFRSAQGRITRQTAALLEATRRDGLTDLLNHGAAVSELAAIIETARTEGRSVTLALMDVDNFRALNDGYGHEAGDRVLRGLTGILSRTMPAGSTIGRYGPDELLVVAPSDGGDELEASVRLTRAELIATALDLGGTDRLPITISAGLCRFPADGSSVTDVLSTLALALGEARASGGDAVRWAHEVPRARAAAGSFDILQGLIVAVDTKDRYTKRHSEDVARYSSFLAQRLGIEDELRRAVHLAGLLHDVGKIGIPDQVLRKPGRLTAEEYGIVQQHVALGDMIVRELPSIDLVRAGVRHHHERWDGTGYLDRLAGDDIPLIARILSVADAFSAMTTTRPYRRALPVGEALRRLEDAAGSQLDERLVRAFVAGMESAPEAPRPGEEVAALRLWVPERLVA